MIAYIIARTGKVHNVARRVEYNPDYIRAVSMLKQQIFTVEDLIRYWQFSGRCIEPHPDIEDIS